MGTKGGNYRSPLTPPCPGGTLGEPAIAALWQKLLIDL